MVVLEARDLTKEYRMGDVTVRALSGVSMEIYDGDFIAIMGPSGSGKSTLLHLLGGLDNPTSGEVFLRGQSYRNMSDDELTVLRRRRVGFIFQFNNLIPTLSTEENIELPLWIDGQDPILHSQRLAAMISLVGLEERKTHKPNQLSGGQQQRVAIARAFANDPEVVLADEPTGNLDSKSGTAILDLLSTACRELGATIVMVTHDARAASYAKRLIFLKDGEITHEQKNEPGSQSMANIMEVLKRLE